MTRAMFWVVVCLCAGLLAVACGDDDDGNGGASSCNDVCDELFSGEWDEEHLDCMGEELIDMGYEEIMESSDCQEVETANACDGCMEDVGASDGDCVDAFVECTG